MSHTHWDREWYRPFQEFRYRLVAFTDFLLDTLAGDPEFATFTLDGQTIILEDYLALHPRREDELRRQVRSGRLLIGPWHVLPDEFLASGESTVRNLLLGWHVCERFGGRMAVGYVPDPFGHIGQLPQILRLCEMDSAVFQRGLSDEPTEVWWEAPDGSRVLALYLRDGYGNAASLPADLPGFVDVVRDRVVSLAPHATTRFVLLMNGDDHTWPQRELPALIRGANQRLNEVRLVHGTLPQLIAAIKQEAGLDGLPEDLAGNPQRFALPVVRGELRSPKRHHLLPGVLSTRMWIKQRNDACETALVRYAEPLAAIGRLLGGRDLRAELWQAWRTLIENHAHDSICGCSIDPVHEEMRTRFAWSEQVAERVAAEGLEVVAAHVTGPAAALGKAGVGDSPNGGRERPALIVTVFNPVAGMRTDRVAVKIQGLPVGQTLCVWDGEGLPVGSRFDERGRSLEFMARDVPGFGYRTYRLESVDAGADELSTSNAQRSAGRVIENEFLRVEADMDDGTLRLMDRRTGVWYSGLNQFADGGDCGDEYNYCPPAQDRVIDRPQNRPRVAVYDEGPLGCQLEVAACYRLPVRLSGDRARRSRVTAKTPIVSRARLRPGVARVDITTTVNNRVEDHRLRVLFPTPLQADYALAEGQFDVVARSLTLPANTTGWVEQPVPTAPQCGFVAVRDGEHGLLVANAGLPEYEVIPGDRGATIGLTLLRCVGWLSRDDFECREGHAGPSLPTPGAQCPGVHTFTYALVPFAGPLPAAMREGHAFRAPLRAAVAPPGSGRLPASLAFVELAPDALVVSAIKPAEDGDGWIVRFWNSADRPVAGKLTCGFEIGSAELANLLERRLAEVEVLDRHTLVLPIRARQIASIRLRPK